MNNEPVHAVLIGDRHNGNSVMLVERNSSRYVYKPRPLRVDDIWYRFCMWCVECGMPHNTIAPRVIDEGEKGYASFIEHTPLDSLSKAPIYYRRAGALIALCYLMCSQDLHAENLIAHGAYPVLVDLETLLNGRVRFFIEPPDSEYRMLRGDFLCDSVLYSALLPHRINDSSLAYPNGSGISGSFEGGLVECKNLPFFEGKTIPAQEYVDDICEGFVETYRWIVEHREEIRNNSPYQEFATCQIRFLIRSTQVYANLINRLTQPDMQSDPEKYEAQLSKLALAFTKYAHPSVLPKLMPIYESEAAAIRRGDIPYFTARADSKVLCDENGNMLYDQYFRVSAFDCSQNILLRMDERDCAFQTELIRASFHASYPPEEKPDILARNASAVLSKDAFLDEASSVYSEIVSHNCEMDDGAPAWPMQCGATEGACGVKMTDIGPYLGRAGVALFGAVLYSVTGNESAHKDAERLVEAMFAEIEDRNSTHLLEKLSLGLASGIGGVLLAIHEIAQYLDKPEYIPRAAAWLDKLTDAWIARDKDYDVISGASGLLLTMYKMSRTRSQQSNVERCIFTNPQLTAKLADHIMENRVSYNNHLLAFRPQMDNLPLTGMGHGAAGISCALFAAWRMTGETRYHEAALDMLAYERECYSPIEMNWPDFRKNPDVAPDQLVYMHGWCAGAPGIGFSRKLMKQFDPTLDVEEDIQHAKQWALNRPGVWRDHLCCGNATLIDWLTECGELEASRDIASRMVARKQKTGKYCLSTFQGEFVTDVGLFSGLSGIGYSLLRAACPERVRTILI